MLFFKNQSEDKKNRYEKLLQIICSLSKLSSDSEIPYLHYRMAENIFCRAFEADNLSRSNISFDAKKNNIALGLKTFILRTSSFEKIAEFNKEKLFIDTLPSEFEKIKNISKLRNKRLEISSNICGVNKKNILYHCVLRSKDKLLVCEQKMPYIAYENITITSSKGNSMFFRDGINEYMFNFSKSTLYKRFLIEPIREIKVKIHNDPYSFLENYFNNIENIEKQTTKSKKIVASICLPLYSTKQEEKYVPKKSGLNQWNASGRPRNSNEIYIPIPKIVHEIASTFFPSRDQEFILKLQNGFFLRAKVCQDGDKALMSNPNMALGKWLLRDVLNLRENELLTYEMLQEIGIDSVQIDKLADGTYFLNFKGLDSFEEFKIENF
jgi:hypothetical protein